MATVLISGGTGLIGKALTNMLVAKGYDVIILTRNISNDGGTAEKISYAPWDVDAGTIDASAIAKADFIVHLAGENIGSQRWTSRRKQAIVDSRVKSGALLAKILNNPGHNVKAVISASAIGWYGPDNTESKKHGFTEIDPHDDSFLGNTCFEWEQSLRPVESMGIRLVFMRTGIVLSNDGGAYPEFKKSLNFGVAAILGNGEQVISWIHIEDICRVYLFAIENQISGPYNAVAPMPVSNKEFMLQTARKLKGKSYIPVHVPVFLIKMVVGEMSIEVLKSTTVNALKIREAGFRFLFPSIDAALNELAEKKPG